ncbi:hypothetical protein ABN080_05375 [Proteus sp. fly-1089]|uniref:hypothetical protein n=1 Tax=Proteus sp. fly-1089 TaxID=3136675 RepID=UPI0032DB3A2F
MDLLTNIETKKITKETYEYISKLGLDKETILKCSDFLIMQLDYIVRSNMENVHKIIREINNLEKNNDYSRTKPAKKFKNPPLKGLYHKHYEGTGLESLKINIQNQLNINEKKHKKALPNFEHWLKEYVKNNKGNKEYFDKEDYFNISHEFAKQLINDSFNQKARNKTITGHWIIYARYNNENYYLCLSRHSNSKDDDFIIRNKIDETCTNKFPFLKKILSPL